MFTRRHLAVRGRFLLTLERGTHGIQADWRIVIETAQSSALSTDMTRNSAIVTNRAMRLEVSQGHKTWCHTLGIVSYLCVLSMTVLSKRLYVSSNFPSVCSLSLTTQCRNLILTQFLDWTFLTTVVFRSLGFQMRV